MHALVNAGPFSARDGEGRRLFEDLSVSLDGGEMVVLHGPSGSGKSTLLRRLAGLERTDGAAFELGGESYADARMPEWRSRVTLVAQDAPIIAGTVGENLRFPFHQRCAGGRQLDEARLAELLAHTGLDGIPERRDAATLSGGERHRLALVRGLLWDPPVLIADEPLSGLDDEMAGACFELLITAAHRPEHAVLCVVHDRDLERRADRHLELSGRIGREGS
jgi:putative ABC transport system ATP-binding protein